MMRMRAEDLDCESRDVFVFLNDQPVRACIEADSREGWVNVVLGFRWDGELKIERRYGEVTGGRLADHPEAAQLLSEHHPLPDNLE